MMSKRSQTLQSILNGCYLYEAQEQANLDFWFLARWSKCACPSKVQLKVLDINKYKTTLKGEKRRPADY